MRKLTLALVAITLLAGANSSFAQPPAIDPTRLEASADAAKQYFQHQFKYLMNMRLALAKDYPLLQPAEGKQRTDEYDRLASIYYKEVKDTQAKIDMYREIKQQDALKAPMAARGPKITTEKCSMVRGQLTCEPS